MTMIDAAQAKAYVEANYQGDPLLRHMFWTLLDKLPTVDAVEVVHGNWIIPTIINGRSFKIPHCSVCGEVPCGVSENTKYCAICGAKMDGERKEA